MFKKHSTITLKRAQMEQEELKRKIMGLWEKTTHNSKEHVATLFDYYFDINNVEYEESQGKVVCALFGIPFNFGYGKNRLKALYMVPLFSEEDLKKKGVLSELISRLNDRIKNEFDFSFLVPHSELLEDFFGTQGYFSSFYILEERYTPLHDFKNDYILSLKDSDDRIKELKTHLFDEIRVVVNENISLSAQNHIISFIESIEKKATSSISLSHSTNDLDYILQQQNLRNLNPAIAYDSDVNVSGVAFIQKDDIKRIKIVAIYVEDTCSYYALLNTIKSQYPDYSISVITSDPKYQAHSLIQQVYVAENPAGPDLDNTFGVEEIPFNVNKLLQPLGMVRLLRFENILDFIASTRSDVDFKLDIRDYRQEGEASKEENEKTDASLHNIYIVKNGKLSVTPKKEIKDEHSVLNLSTKELSELLLRKNDSSNLIMEAFGIPRLNLQMRLLPC